MVTVVHPEVKSGDEMDRRGGVSKLNSHLHPFFLCVLALVTHDGMYLSFKLTEGDVMSTRFAQRYRSWLCTIVLILVFMVIFNPFGTVTPQLESVKVILNSLWDRENHRLDFTQHAAANGVLETEITIWNDVWDRATNAIRVLTDLSPIVDLSMYIRNYEVTTLSGAQSLCAHNYVPVDTETNGASLTLPLASNRDCSGEFELVIEAGTGPMSLSPAGADTIGVYGNSSPTPITGIGNRYILRRKSNTGWDIKVSSGLVLGSLGGIICQTGPGSTNNSSSGSGEYVNHSLSCTIPANTLKANSVVESCSVWKMVTGSVPPTLSFDVVFDSQTIMSNWPAITVPANVTSRVITNCFSLVVGAVNVDTGNALAYAGPVVGWDAMGVNAIASNVAEIITFSVAEDNILYRRTYWGSAGTGTSTIQELATHTRLTNP